MKKNNFIEGAFIATIAVIITKILGMLYVIPFYKIIGIKGGALYSYAYNIYLIFLSLSSAGIPMAISKIVSEYSTLKKDEAKYRTYKLGIRIISYISIVAFLIMFICANFIAKSIIGDFSGGNSKEEVAFVIRSISFAILIIPYLSVTKGYIQGHKIMKPTSTALVIEQVVRISVILLGSFISYKVFSSSVTISVGIAVTGAFFGGLASYIYLKIKMSKSKNILGIKEYSKKDAISDKQIIKKIIQLSVPFIIVNITTSIYNYTDMILILRGLKYLQFSTFDAEFIQSAITTWSYKICMIVSSFAMGMVVSLIPNMVSSYIVNDWKKIGNRINKAYQIILTISIPAAVGISILSKPIWIIFYGPNIYGPNILAMAIITTIFSNLYSITFNAMQSLNKYKKVYISILFGLLINAVLDIPLMVFFNKINIPAYWGASISTLIGYVISIKIATHDLKKNHNISFNDTYKTLKKLLMPTIVMSITLIIFNYFIRFDMTNTISVLMMITINTLIGAIIYVIISYKMNIFTEVFGSNYVNKIIKKLTFNRVSLH